ncbi:relaxase/mobilization nuclease domain-containing protein [Oscillibacter sp.]|uniref:relaxase/mobilization nuclease domain-containing protein n=1 Tax=Oscillibacter sp. TaxID=1945593 RepID=UPI002897FED2|nr:relaxase/mobilization nuclease domain-containing protein [Oscillibacter sp.]
MAIVTAIKEKTQSRTAMKKVMDYVAQDYKTLFQNQNGEQYRLLSGQNCCGETAFQEFMATKKQYRKENKVFFYQYVQSFKPDCGATPQEIHQMGMELARWFEGYEVQIATHIDRDHWHNHLIVNSVSCETGLKLQFNEKDLEQLRTLSDEICVAHGLEILKPYQKPAMKPMGAGEYRSAVRGGSFKFQLMNAIDTALFQSRTQAEFTACMEEMGYGVKWIPHHKYITYTAPSGQRCRDNKLHDEKYLKERMEQHFAQLERTQGFEQAQYSSPAAGSGSVNFLHSDRQHDSQRGMAEYPVQPSGGGAATGDTGGIYLHAPEHRRCEQDDEKLLCVCPAFYLFRGGNKDGAAHAYRLSQIQFHSTTLKKSVFCLGQRTDFFCSTRKLSIFQNNPYFRAGSSVIVKPRCRSPPSDLFSHFSKADWRKGT